MAYYAVMLFDVLATIYCNKFEYREVMNMIKALAIIGIIGGMLCAVADLLLDLKGVDNQKLGKMRVIDSKWREMSHGRFVWYVGYFPCTYCYGTYYFWNNCITIVVYYS